MLLSFHPTHQLHRPFGHRDALYNKKFKQLSAVEADTPRGTFVRRMLFSKSEGFQHAEEDTRVDEDKQTTDSKNEGHAFRGDDGEEQW